MRSTLLDALIRKPVPYTLAGHQVTLRPLSVQDVADMRSLDEEGAVDALAVVRSVCDLTGKRVFSDDDVGEVAKFDGGEIGRLNAAIAELNRIGLPAGKAPSPTSPS